MGKTAFNTISQEGQANLLTPEQQSFLTNLLGQNQQGAQQAYSDFLQPYNPEQFQQFYQQSFIDPAQKALREQIIPGLKEQFGGLDESGSSALNRALAQSATDVSSMLGQGIMGQYNQTQQNRMGALGGLQGLLGQRTFEPMITQHQGWLNPLLGALGSVGGGALAGALSSRQYKENIRPFYKGLEALKTMHAYQYDYKPEISPEKGQIGVMIEDSPEELVKEVDGMKVMDIYGLVSLLVNGINELSAKVDALGRK